MFLDGNENPLNLPTSFQSNKLTIASKSSAPKTASSITPRNMARPVSGTYQRVDRVRASAGTFVRLVLDGSSRELSATLHELGMSDLLLSCADRPRLGTRVSVAITLPGRYLEFEIPGMVTWHLDGKFGVSFDYLSARQTYGLVLAIDVISRAAEEAPLQARGRQR